MTWKMKYCAAALVAMGSAVPTMALAQTGGTGGTACELHLWPGERVTSITSGLLGPGLLDSALHAKKDATNKANIANALDSAAQLDSLAAEDLPGLLGLPAGTTTVKHTDPLDRHTMNKIKTRRSDSQSKCYFELIVADVFYQKAAIYGRSLRTLFLLRRFGDDQVIDSEYKAWGGNGLKLFPPKDGEDATAAVDELVSVFIKNFKEYAANERKTGAASKS